MNVALIISLTVGELGWIELVVRVNVCVYVWES